MFAIESNIPLPTARGFGRPQGATKYPFRAMSVGDSFAVPFKASEKAGRIQTQLAANAYYHGKKLGAKFSTRVNGQVVRVWRVA